MSDEQQWRSYYMPETNSGRIHIEERGDVAIYLRSDPGMDSKELEFYGDLFAKAIENMDEYDRERAEKFKRLSEKRELVEEIKRVCQENYDNGGDEVIEDLDDIDIAWTFNSVEDAKRYCGIMVEQVLNQRWGEDDDPQLQKAEAFKNWKDA